MKPWQTPINKALNKEGKGRNKERGPKSELKGKNPKWVTKGKRTNHVPKPPLVAQSIFERKRNGKLERTLSLEEASLATTMCFKIETT